MLTQQSTANYSRWLPWSVCTLAAMFYLYEFILQVSPSVMTQELMRDLNLNAAGLGTMVAFYYYAYAPMQIPAGLLFDRYGPRLLITIALIVCAAGAIFFGTTTSIVLASAGRFLMGIGSAFSFIGALLLVARWFEPKYFALLAGIVQLMSSFGAMVGEVPLAAAVANFGWRSTITGTALAGFVLAFIVWLFVKDWPPGEEQHKTSKHHPGELKRLSYVLKKSQTWWISLYSFTSWAPVTVFPSLWGVKYLEVAYGISAIKASAACSMVWLGIGIGSPLIGLWSDKINRRCLPLTITSLLGVIALVIILYLPNLSLLMVFLLLFVFGLAASGQSLSFALVKDINVPQVAGTAIGFNNMAVVAGGALFQPLVGFLLQISWDGQSSYGAPVYAANDYRSALFILPLCYFAGMLISMKYLRETRCQALTENEFEMSDASYNMEAITP